MFAGYGTSIHASPPSPVYGAPYALPDVSHISILPTFDLGWPLALKLNAFTIAKIILKLVIFKMIVKFIAVICLLLFIPKLEIIKKKGNKGEDDEERGLSSRKFLMRSTQGYCLVTLTCHLLSNNERFALYSLRHFGNTERSRGYGTKLRREIRDAERRWSRFDEEMHDAQVPCRRSSHVPRILGRLLELIQELHGRREAGHAAGRAVRSLSSALSPSSILAVSSFPTLFIYLLNFPKINFFDIECFVFTQSTVNFDCESD